MRIFLALVILLGTLPAHATVLVYKDLDDLVREADGVVIGTVRRVESADLGTGNVYTFVTLGELELLHGRHDREELTLRLEGGRVGRYGVRVEGSPSFAPGQRMLLFLSGNGRDPVPLVGWGQGLFRIVSEPGVPEPVVTDELGNRVLGVEGRRLLTERAIRRDVPVVGEPRLYEQESEPADTRVEESTGGDTRPERPARGRPLTLGEFRRALEPRLREKGAPKVLEPVDPRAVPAERDPRDAPAPGETAVPEPRPMGPPAGTPLEEPKPAPESEVQKQP